MKKFLKCCFWLLVISHWLRFNIFTMVSNTEPLVNSLFAQENLVKPPVSYRVKKPKIIRIGSGVGGGYGRPFALGILGILQTKGLLEEEFKNDKIKIEYYIFKGAGPGLNEALANESVDFAYGGDLGTLVGKAGGLKTKFIANCPAVTHIYVGVPADSSITSIKELKGKKVALTRGTAFDLLFQRVLQANGLSDKDFKLYNLTQIDGEAALISKSVDVGVYPCTLLALRDRGVLKIISSTKDTPWRYSIAFLVTEKFATTYPEIVKRVVKAYVQAALWASEEKNREESLQIWAKSGWSLSSLKEDREGMSAKLMHNPLLDEYTINYYKEAVIFAQERGYIKKTFDVDKWVDLSYLESALKELGVEGYWP